MKKTNIDMTKGHMMPLILRFAIPVVFANILQMLYGLADTWVVGNFCDDAALAAIGTSSQPVEIVLCIFLGLGSGVSILVSQAAGQHDDERVKRVVSTATTFLYVVAIPLTFIGFLVSPALLTLMQTPQSAYDYALAYIRIIFLGTVAQMGYNMNAGILRGLGDSISSLVFLIISSILNVGLDLLFTIVFGMGVTGVAIATVIAQFVSWFSSMVYLKVVYKKVDYSPLIRKIDKQLLIGEMKIGFPLGFNTSIYSVGHLLMQTVINMQGDSFAAATTVATKITGMAIIGTTAFSQAAMTYSGQNYGARDLERLKRGSLRIPLFSGLINLVAGAIVCLLARQIAYLFNDNEVIVDYAVRYVRVVLPFYWCYAVFNGIINYVHGVGDIVYPTIINIAVLWGIRIPAAFILNAAGLGTWCMAGISLSFVCGMIGMMFYYTTKRWKRLVDGTPVPSHDR